MHQLKSIFLLACLLCCTSALPSWLSVDPLADKYPYISPYAYCNWNPVKNIDPDGMYFDEANEIIAQKIEEHIQARKNGTTCDYKVSKLNKTLRDISDMRKDRNHGFYFIQNDSEEARNYGIDVGGGVCVISQDESKIGIISNITSLQFIVLDETIVHEVRHGGQIARGELVLEKNYSNYNYRHEIDAYKAQWSYFGLCLPTKKNVNGQTITSPSQINKNFIYSIIHPETKEPLYEKVFGK